MNFGLSSLPTGSAVVVAPGDAGNAPFRGIPPPYTTRAFRRHYGSAMTLIIGVATTDFALLVADRRIINAANRKPMSESHVKVIAHPWAGSWGSSGLAHVDGKPAITWFRDVFAHVVQPGMSQFEVRDALGRAVSEQAKLDPLMQKYDLTFGGAALFENDESGRASIPTTFAVGNNIRQSTTGAPEPTPVSGTFCGFAFSPPPGKELKPYDTMTLVLPCVATAEQGRLIRRAANSWRDPRTHSDH